MYKIKKQKKKKEKTYSVEKQARNMVGDGKLPNKYFVSYDNHFVVLRKNYLTPIEEDKDKKFLKIVGKAKGKTAKIFDTYQEAKDYAYELAEQISEDNDEIRTVTIEDRLSGELFRSQLVAHPNRKFGGYNFKIDEYEDTRFTKEALEKKGIEFK